MYVSKLTQALVRLGLGLGVRLGGGGGSAEQKHSLSRKTQQADSQEEAPHPGSEMQMDSLAAGLTAPAEVLPLGSRRCLSQQGAP